MGAVCAPISSPIFLRNKQMKMKIKVEKMLNAIAVATAITLKAKPEMIDSKYLTFGRIFFNDLQKVAGRYITRQILQKYNDVDSDDILDCISVAVEKIKSLPNLYTQDFRKVKITAKEDGIEIEAWGVSCFIRTKKNFITNGDSGYTFYNKGSVTVNASYLVNTLNSFHPSKEITIEYKERGGDVHFCTSDDQLQTIPVFDEDISIYKNISKKENIFVSDRLILLNALGKTASVQGNGYANQWVENVNIESENNELRVIASNDELSYIASYHMNKGEVSNQKTHGELILPFGHLATIKTVLQKSDCPEMSISKTKADEDKKIQIIIEDEKTMLAMCDIDALIDFDMSTSTFKPNTRNVIEINIIAWKPYLKKLIRNTTSKYAYTTCDYGKEALTIKTENSSRNARFGYKTATNYRLASEISDLKERFSMKIPFHALAVLTKFARKSDYVFFEYDKEKEMAAFRFSTEKNKKLGLTLDHSIVFKTKFNNETI